MANMAEAPAPGTGAPSDPNAGFWDTYDQSQDTSEQDFWQTYDKPAENPMASGSDISKLKGMDFPDIPERAPDWSMNDELKYGFMLGYHPEMLASQNAHQRFMDNPTGPGEGEIYDQSLKYYREQHDKWVSQHPYKAFAADTLAALPALMGGESLVEGGLMAGAKAAPRAEPAINFLLGKAGSVEEPGIADNLLRAGSRITSGAIRGGGQAAAQSHMNPDVPMSEQIGLGAGIGAALHGVTGALGDLFHFPVGKADPETINMMDSSEVRNLPERVKPTGGQLTNDRNIAASSALELGEGKLQDQNKYFTQELVKTFDPELYATDPDKAVLSQEVLTNAKNKLGKVLDSGYVGKSYLPDNGFIQKLNQIYRDGKSNIAAGTDDDKMFDQIFNTLKQNIKPTALGGSPTGYAPIKGEILQSLVDKNSAIGNAVNSGSHVSGYANRVKDVLDTFVQDSMKPAPIGHNSSFAQAAQYARELADWQDFVGAKQKYKDLMVAQDLYNSNGTVSGRAVPSALAGALMKHYTTLPSNDIGGLAKIGKLLPSPTQAGGMEQGFDKQRNFWRSLFGGTLMSSKTDKVSVGAAAIGTGIAAMPALYYGGYLPSLAAMGLVGGGLFAAKAANRKYVQNMLESPAYRDAVLGVAKKFRAPEPTPTTAQNLMLAARKAALPLAMRMKFEHYTTPQQFQNQYPLPEDQ